MTLVIVGAGDQRRLDRAVAAFAAAGFQPAQELAAWTEGDGVLPVREGAVELLREADQRGIRYTLVHDGPDDGEPGGTYERAHHRVEGAQLEELARHLRSRERPLVTCLAFAYRNGPPADAALLVDTRFLDNPYWVPELRELDGRDQSVVDFVLKQKPAVRLLDDLERIVRDLLPLYHQRGRMNLTLAFGCTGGQHRSVAMAAEMVRRLRSIDSIEVELVTRDLER